MSATSLLSDIFLTDTFYVKPTHIHSSLTSQTMVSNSYQALAMFLFVHDRDYFVVLGRHSRGADAAKRHLSTGCWKWNGTSSYHPKQQHRHRAEIHQCSDQHEVSCQTSAYYYVRFRQADPTDMTNKTAQPATVF